MTIKAIPEGPRIIPYLLYEDVAATVEWLTRAFGLEEHGDRYTGDDGRVNHAAMKIGDGIVMMGCPGADYKNPKQLGQITQQLYIFVEDVDAHCARARAAGAEIVREPADQFYGDRQYGAKDPEGHCWFFAQHIRDVSPEEMRAGA
jgi:uncharacterized glyoxalase superfamily protein PhnB